MLANCILKRSKLLRLPVQPFLAVCVTHHRSSHQSLYWNPAKPILVLTSAISKISTCRPQELVLRTVCVYVCACVLVPDVPVLEPCRYVYAAAEWACRKSSRWPPSLVTTAGSRLLILGCRRRGGPNVPPLSVFRAEVCLRDTYSQTVCAVNKHWNE